MFTKTVPMPMETKEAIIIGRLKGRTNELSEKVSAYRSTLNVLNTASVVLFALAAMFFAIDQTKNAGGGSAVSIFCIVSFCETCVVQAVLAFLKKRYWTMAAYIAIRTAAIIGMLVLITNASPMIG